MECEAGSGATTDDSAAERAVDHQERTMNVSSSHEDDGQHGECGGMGSTDTFGAQDAEMEHPQPTEDEHQLVDSAAETDSSSSSDAGSAVDCEVPVLDLRCAACSNLLSQRGMQVQLVSDPSVCLFSTDFRPEGVVEAGQEHAHEACRCLIKDVMCSRCLVYVGYHVIRPCDNCGAADHNEHYFQMNCSKVKAEPRVDIHGQTVTWITDSLTSDDACFASRQQPFSCNGPGVDLANDTSPTDESSASSGSGPVAMEMRIADPNAATSDDMACGEDEAMTCATLTLSSSEDAASGAVTGSRIGKRPCASSSPCFTCPLCFEPTAEPYAPPCLHAACLRCVTRALDLRRACPCCRRPTTCSELALLPPDVVAKLIGEPG